MSNDYKEFFEYIFRLGKIHNFDDYQKFCIAKNIVPVASCNNVNFCNDKDSVVINVFLFADDSKDMVLGSVKDGLE